MRRRPVAVRPDDGSPDAKPPLIDIRIEALPHDRPAHLRLAIEAPWEYDRRETFRKTLKTLILRPGLAPAHWIILRQAQDEVHVMAARQGS